MPTREQFSYSIIDTDEYGFLGLNNTNSIWPQNNINLPSPTLNISGFPIDRYDTTASSRLWVDPRTGQKPFLDEKQISYVYNNETYDYNYIITEGNGQCQPIGVSRLKPAQPCPLVVRARR
jgi:hypothetical protein